MFTFHSVISNSIQIQDALSGLKRNKSKWFPIAQTKLIKQCSIKSETNCQQQNRRKFLESNGITVS